MVSSLSVQFPAIALRACRFDRATAQFSLDMKNKGVKCYQYMSIYVYVLMRYVYVLPYYVLISHICLLLYFIIIPHFPHMTPEAQKVGSNSHVQIAIPLQECAQ